METLDASCSAAAEAEIWSYLSIELPGRHLFVLTYPFSQCGEGLACSSGILVESFKRYCIAQRLSKRHTNHHHLRSCKLKLRLLTTWPPTPSQTQFS